MDYLRVCPDPQKIEDEDYLNILYEFAMNFSQDSFRKAYWDNKKAEEERVTRDDLRELGYDEEDLEGVEI